MDAGPNRSFPCNDCNHIRAALSMLGRYKGPGNKATIRACIYRKARALNCFKTGKGAKKDTEENWTDFMERIESEANFRPAILDIAINYHKGILDAQEAFVELITFCDTSCIESTEFAKVVDCWYYDSIDKACMVLIHILSK